MKPKIALRRSIKIRHSAASYACYLLFTFILPACTPQPHAPTKVVRTPAFNSEEFRDGKVYKLIPAESELQIRVYRGGVLARLGHNHIVSSRGIFGKIYRHASIEKSGIVLTLPVESFVVDDDLLRANAGAEFDSTPSASDIADTRKNMLSAALLDAGIYPYIKMRSVKINERNGSVEVQIRISVKSHSQDFNINVEVQEKIDETLVISGNTKLSHADLGLTPFSILGGAIAVKEELDIDFRFIALQIAN